MMPPGWTVAEDTNPPRFSERDIERFKERRQIAKASSLRKQTLLHFSLPSLYPNSTYNSALSFPQSPNPPRQASQSLLTLLSDSSPRPLTLKLVKGIVKGAGSWSQVWRAEIDVQGRKRKVIVKLYAESLFPIPVHPVDGEWQSGDDSCKREADAYQSFRSTQGRDVPICYGFFYFSTPWNESVKGVILEDLTKIALPLPTFGRNFTHIGDGFEERDSDDDSDESSLSDAEELPESTTDSDLARSRAKKLQIFILRLYESQRRLHSLSHGVTSRQGSNVFVLHSSTLDKPHFAFLGFAHTATQTDTEAGLNNLREEVRREHGEKVAQQISTDFRASAERQMTNTVERIFGRSVGWEWREMNLFEFV